MRNSAMSVLDSVADDDALGLYKDGHLDRAKLAKVVDVRQRDFEKVASAQGVVGKQRMPDLVREVLEQVATTALFVGQAFGGDMEKTSRWFRTPNPLLGFATPRDMIRFGRHQKLQYLVTTSARLGSAG